MSSTATTRRTLSRKTERIGRPLNVAASTPNLNQLYSQSSRLGPSALGRKGSCAALTHNSLAAIPDDSEYGYKSVLNDTMPLPFTPARTAPAVEVMLGDTVDVPGDMAGTVRFIGAVAGRKGIFVGVELHREHALKGKNSGDVDGVRYFTTSLPGAGIFLPLSKAVRRESPPNSATSSFPLSPTESAPAPATAPAFGGLKMGNQNSTNQATTPAISKFTQSVGPGRASSPAGRFARPSMARPESPAKRLLMTPARPTATAPGSRMVGRFGSPTAGNPFAQSVRGTAADPCRKATHVRKTSLGPRSASVLGNGNAAASSYVDDEAATVGMQRTRTNGSNGSASSHARQVRPPSRTASRSGNYNDEDVRRLQADNEIKDHQLQEQAVALAEMESSLEELQGLLGSSGKAQSRHRRRGSSEDNVVQLRAALREKNEKIAALTAEFDAHRADFRSTIDTLELASSETERVYEKKMEELTMEIQSLQAEMQELQDRTADVDAVASQLRQLEELVQDLEEGLEDARRGEAEARGEVEFLRGEVERTRTELRREREKAERAERAERAEKAERAENAENTEKAHASTNGVYDQPEAAMCRDRDRELEQKEDEIRGLKAIIHSLSQDTELEGASGDDHAGRGRLEHEHELDELRARLDDKIRREEDLERELEELRRHSIVTGSLGQDRDQDRDVDRGHDQNSGNEQERPRESPGTVKLSPPARVPRKDVGRHGRVRALDTHESDAFSVGTENSTLWCEICETSGHDILSCTNIFATDSHAPLRVVRDGDGDGDDDHDVTPTQQQEHPQNQHQQEQHQHLESETMASKPAPLSPVKVRAPASVPATVRILPNPMDSGPVAGRESGVVDGTKWCAVCERDGHDSVDCPFEDAL